MFHAAVFAANIIGLTIAPAPEAQGPIETTPNSSPEFRTVVEPSGKAQRALDRRTPGFATAVDLDQEPGTVPDDALGEVVARTPGAHVRSLGGLGQF